MRDVRSIFTMLMAAWCGWCGAGSLCADDTARVSEWLASGSIVTIPPGEYRLDGAVPIPLRSGLTVRAHGARFLLPETLGDRARLVLFAGENLTQFTWEGGEFVGHVFDPERETNAWEPNVNTRVFLLTTTATGTTADILFRDVQARDIAGAVITVLGRTDPKDDAAVLQSADRVTVENCTLLRSGKFMWDYGYLWQQLVWPDEYDDWQVARARKYFRTDLLRGGVTIAAGADRIRFDQSQPAWPISKTTHPREAVCFVGRAVPRNIIRGKAYYVVASDEQSLAIAEAPGGEPLRFETAAGPGIEMVRNVHEAFLALYAPIGSGPGKGAVDLVACRDVRVTGCRLSALGDAMHIQKSRNIIFANNQILGARMGAFFLAEHCFNATIQGNLIDGTNGSRVMSVEKSCTDVTIIGNTFRNGGRGSWINQPRNLVLQGNIFENNTTKGTPDWQRGRRSWKTGNWETFPEVYFTTYEPMGTYGAVIVRDNIFRLGDDATAAIQFEPRGSGILLEGNILTGTNANSRVLIDGDTAVEVGTNNIGLIKVERRQATDRFGNP